jgi:hypothetical protein
VQLESLGLDKNSIEGSIPSALCARGSALKDLYLAGNRLVGSVALGNCSELITLDVQVGGAGCCWLVEAESLGTCRELRTGGMRINGLGAAVGATRAEGHAAGELGAAGVCPTRRL